MSKLGYAPDVWKLLNGVVCLYKPAGQASGAVRNSILVKLCNELNELEQRPPRTYVAIEGDTTKEMTVSVRPSYADNTLLTGPRYQIDDFRCRWATYLGRNTSGVFVLGLNRGTKQAYNIHVSRPMRVYHVTGVLGYTTDNLFKTGKIVEESKYTHVKKRHIDKVLSEMQASHQKLAYELCGVDPESQEAYELASQGLVRPVSPNVPIVYGAKCLDFNPPNFTIEIHCTNEYEAYLMALIHSIGIKARTSTTCVGIQCVRHSHFHLEHALLKKHWTLEMVISQMGENRKIVKKTGELTRNMRRLSASS